MEIYEGEPCYFYVDEQNYVRSLCLKCGKKSDKGWLWQEARYGNWDVTCFNCGHFIHKKKRCKKKQKQDLRLKFTVENIISAIGL